MPRPMNRTMNIFFKIEKLFMKCEWGLCSESSAKLIKLEQFSPKKDGSSERKLVNCNDEKELLGFGTNLCFDVPVISNSTKAYQKGQR